MYYFKYYYYWKSIFVRATANLYLIFFQLFIYLSRSKYLQLVEIIFYERIICCKTSKLGWRTKILLYQSRLSFTTFILLIFNISHYLLIRY